VLAPVICFFVYKVAGYRIDVVRENLRKAFPEKSEEERRTIERKFYRHLSTLFVDTIDLTSISKKQILKRLRYLNNDEQEARVAGQSWICAMAHYGSWEYMMNYPLVTDHRFLVVYHRLHNPVFDRFYRHIRTRCGAVPVERDNVGREMVRTRGEQQPPVSLALIADQSPTGQVVRHWFDFLNQPTAFFPGIEKIALKYKLPVCFLRVEPVKRGYYTAVFEEIYDGREAVGEWEITRRYVQKLEELIRERPELWLWSHRRWKHTQEDAA
jgi:KDO2-lipid IV(A) lauroyltransferase